jgi:hypothetical protein
MHRGVFANRLRQSGAEERRKNCVRNPPVQGIRRLGMSWNDIPNGVSLRAAAGTGMGPIRYLNGISIFQGDCREAIRRYTYCAEIRRARISL